MLNDIYQRRHEVFQSVAKQILQTVDIAQRQKVEQLILELSLVTLSLCNAFDEHSKLTYGTCDVVAEPFHSCRYQTRQ